MQVARGRGASRRVRLSSLGGGLGALSLLAACDVLVGLPDVPPVLEAGVDAAVKPGKDASHDVTRHADARADAHVSHHDAPAPQDAGRDAPRPPKPCANGTLTDAGCFVVLASDAGWPCSLAIDDERVYWTDYGDPSPVHDAASYDAGSVRAVAKDGGEVTTIATGQLRPLRLVRHGGELAWIDQGLANDAGTALIGSIHFTDVTRDSGQKELSGYPDLYGVALTDASVYWTENTATGYVVKSALGDAMAVEVTDVPPGEATWGIVVAGDRIYLTLEEGAAGEVVASALDGSAAMTLATMQYLPWGLAVANGHVYWLTRNGRDGGAPSAMVMSAPIDGGPAATLAVADGGFPYILAVDDKNVYWTDVYKSMVMRVALDGGGLTTLVSCGDASGPEGIAVDDASVYWTEFGGHVVRKLTPK